jgi:hypothetical protein
MFYLDLAELFGVLCDLDTNEELRPATEAELKASIAAAYRDGGAGAIKVEGRMCFVKGGFSLE